MPRCYFLQYDTIYDIIFVIIIILLDHHCVFIRSEFWLEKFNIKNEIIITSFII